MLAGKLEWVFPGDGVGTLWGLMAGGMGQGGGTDHCAPQPAVSPSTSVSRISSQDARISPSSSPNSFARGCHLMGGRILCWTSSQTTGDHILRPHKLSLPWKGRLQNTGGPAGGSWLLLGPCGSGIRACIYAHMVPCESSLGVLPESKNSPLCPAQPPYLAVPLPQFQDHEWRALFGVLRVLVQQEVLKDKRLRPCGGCRAPEALGTLAVMQEDQANEGPCRWGHGVKLSCQVRLSSLAAAATGPGTWAGLGWASQPLSESYRHIG